MRIIKAIGIALIVWVITGLTAPAHAKEKPPYKEMIGEIGTFLNEALIQYKKGNIQEAKSKAQAAYFEVFENLEGPIRINISAKKKMVIELAPQL